MKTRIEKWGDGLALRIPRSFVAEMGLNGDCEVDVVARHGKLVVTPVADAQRALDSLLAQVTDENAHGEWDTGSAVGREAW